MAAVWVCFWRWKHRQTIDFKFDPTLPPLEEEVGRLYSLRQAETTGDTPNSGVSGLLGMQPRVSASAPIPVDPFFQHATLAIRNRIGAVSVLTETTRHEDVKEDLQGEDYDMCLW